MRGVSDEGRVTISGFLLARIGEDRWTGFYRIHDETGVTHLATGAMRTGSSLCAGTDDAPDPGTGIVEPVALPGQPWPGGSVCRSCARVASGRL